MNPAYAETLNNLGAVYEALNNVESAISHYYSAIKNNPNYASACYNLARLHAKSDSLSLSLEYLNRSISLDPQLEEEALSDEYLSQVLQWDIMRRLQQAKYQ